MIIWGKIQNFLWFRLKSDPQIITLALYFKSMCYCRLYIKSSVASLAKSLWFQSFTERRRDTLTIYSWNIRYGWKLSLSTKHGAIKLNLVLKDHHGRRPIAIVTTPKIATSSNGEKWKPLSQSIISLSLTRKFCYKYFGFGSVLW